MREHLRSPQQSKQRPASEVKIQRHGVSRAGRKSILERGRMECDEKCCAQLHVTDFFPSDDDQNAREPRER